VVDPVNVAATLMDRSAGNVPRTIRKQLTGSSKVTFSTCDNTVGSHDRCFLIPHISRIAHSPMLTGRLRAATIRSAR
jgi:hypothetical protein